MTYSQNLEDLRLWRALKDVENGSYIDIGAWHPVEDSVSQHFYLNGWRGINIEPEVNFFKILQQHRPEDQNFCFTVGNSIEERTFHVVKGTGLSTGKIDMLNFNSGFNFEVEQILVRDFTLDAVASKVLSNEVHWMKIDVEGEELNVISSWTNTEFKPWILVIEATTPGTQEPSYDEWETLILDKGYIFAYFDGLNRFYVSESSTRFIKILQEPISVFDEVVCNRELIRNQEIQFLETNYTTLETNYQNLIASLTMRSTSALRSLYFKIRKIKATTRHHIETRNFIDTIIKKFITQVYKYPVLKNQIIRCLPKGLAKVLRQRIFSKSPVENLQSESKSHELLPSRRILLLSLQLGNVNEYHY